MGFLLTKPLGGRKRESCVLVSGRPMKRLNRVAGML
jgi:hypothetical protein